jgi:hypothetical protein
MRKIGGGFDNYYFFPGFSVPNYLNMFTKINPTIILGHKEKFILISLSEYHVRLLEQSIISFIKLCKLLLLKHLYHLLKI